MKPGQEVQIDVTLKRRPDYDKGVSLDVLLRHLGGVFGNPLPPGVTLVRIDPISGELATPECPQTLEEAFYDGTEPTALCPLHAHVEPQTVSDTAPAELPEG